MRDGRSRVHGVDGRRLRADLTAAARAHEGEDFAMRKAALGVLKAANQSGRAAVRERLAAGAGGVGCARAMADLADEIISALYDFTTVHVIRARNPTEGERLSVCAVGGFGRSELAPFSDIDLLFLRAYKPTPWDESVIEYMHQMLWDLGFKVGSSARTVDQCVRLAKDDWSILTSMLDLRRLVGDAEFPEVLNRRFIDEVLKNRARDFVAAKLSERDARLERQGQASRYMVEPDIKEGKGALRDLQLLDWLVRGVGMARGEGGAVARLLRREEARLFEEPADLFWRIRANLHWAANRAQDRLTFDLQPEVARRMGFLNDDESPDVEGLMRRYFLAAKDVGALTRVVCAKLEAEEAKREPISLMRLFPKRTRRAELDEPGLCLENGRVAFADPTLPEVEPAAMLRLYRALARSGADIHPDALSAIGRAVDRIDDDVREDPVAAQAFFDVLLEAKNVEAVLRLMNESGLLGAFLPEFGGIVGRTQFNMYHYYTVDEHTLRVVGSLADLEKGRMADDAEFAKRLFAKIDNRRALYLAALMHDTGKGQGDQQEEGAKSARSAAERLGLPPEEVEIASWLVGHHLFMSDVAQRRDLGDPRTVADFAREVATPERLRLLTLLTIADINGVGPGVWTAWKRRLLYELYELAEAVFRGGRTTEEHAKTALAERAQAQRDALVDSAPEDARVMTRRWADLLEDAYWLAFDTPAQARHRDIAEAAYVQKADTYVDARWLPVTQAAEFVVLADDRPGLFAGLAGAIADAGGDVRGARGYTTREGRVFDVFIVGFPGVRTDEGLNADWALLTRAKEAVFTAAAAKTNPPRARPEPSRRTRAFEIEPSVTIDNEASQEASVIEVSGRDHPGLLADLAEALSDAGVNVLSAHIENYGERAMDVFYAAERAGGKITNASRRAAIRRKLLAALSDGDVEPPKAGARELARARASDAR